MSAERNGVPTGCRRRTGRPVYPARGLGSAVGAGIRMPAAQKVSGADAQCGYL